MPTNAPNGNLKIMAYVKAVICGLLVLTACAAVLLRIGLPPYFIELVLGVLGIYFGFSGLLYYQSAKADNTQLVALIKAIVREELAIRERE